MSKPQLTAEDIKATMAASIKQGMAAAAAPSDPSTPHVEVRGHLPDKRFTVVITNDQHRFLKRFALDANSDASTVARLLFTMLETDASLAQQVRSRL